MLARHDAGASPAVSNNGSAGRTRYIDTPVPSGVIVIEARPRPLGEQQNHLTVDQIASACVGAIPSWTTNLNDR